MAYKLKHVADGTAYQVSQAPRWTQGIWECGDQRFTDETGTEYTDASDRPYPVITPPQMRLLYTSPERVYLKANIAGTTPDPIIHDFFTELADPQLKEVDLNLDSVQKAIGYSLQFVGPHMTPQYTPEIIAARFAAMLTGVPQ